MKRILAFIGLLGVIYALIWQLGMFSDAPAGAAATAPRIAARPVRASTPGRASDPQACDGAALAEAYRNHLRRVEVCGRGTLARVLPDDLRGSRHQRFIVRQPTGHTLLIAYNMDIAPRIAGLRPGMPIEFAGEYEWNPQGGVIHWTHRDPAGQHPAGWIRYEDRLYQ